MLSTLSTNPILFIVSIAGLVMAVTVHEFAHAFTADRLGDPTPRHMGRISLNPLRHLDLYGSLFLLLFGFGWGKPVQYDPFNLKNPKKDSMLIAFAGPMSNFIIALICSAFIFLLNIIEPSLFVTIGYGILSSFIYINLLLGLFNLIPIAPLDGFSVVRGLLPHNQEREWAQLERYGFIFLILLIIPFGSRSLLDMTLRPILSFIYQILV